jgi:hypothetical protein
LVSWQIKPGLVVAAINFDSIRESKFKYDVIVVQTMDKSGGPLPKREKAHR